MSEDDRYTYPGSGGVLVNKFGIRDAQRLDEALNDYATAAWFELRRHAAPEPPDFSYLRTIHEQLFSRVLTWAGELRETDAQAVGAGIAYCRPGYIQDSLRTLFDKFGREDYLSGLDARTFADRLADRWGELSAIHPFRDGNTRSQSAYVSVLAARAAHPIGWQQIDVDTLRRLRLHAVAGREKPLADYLYDHLLSRGAVTSAASPARVSFARPAGEATRTGSVSGQGELRTVRRAARPIGRGSGELER